MAVVHRLQPSFNNGEVSPLLYDRVDYQKFVSSVKTGKNMFVHPQGGMSNRAGTIMLAQAKQATVRLIPFEFSSTETYIIEFGNYYCRFYTAEGQVTSGGVVYEIESPFSTADLFKIRYCQSGDVMYIAWGGKPKKLTRYGHTNWLFEDYNYQDGPVSFYNEKKGILNKITESAPFDYIMALYDNSDVYSASNLNSWTLLNIDYNIASFAQKANNYLFSVEYVNGQGFMVYSSDGVGWSRLGNNIKATRYFKIYYINSTYYLYTGANNSDGNTNFYTFTAFNNIVSKTVPFGTIVGSIKYLNDYFILNAYVPDTYYYRTYVSSDFNTWSNINKVIIGDCENLYFLNGYYYAFGVNGNTGAKWDTSFNFVQSFNLPNYVRRGSSISGKIYLDLFVRNTTNDAIYVFNDSTLSCSKIFDEGGYFFLYGNSDNFITTNTDLYQLNTSTDVVSLVQKNVSGYISVFL